MIVHRNALLTAMDLAERLPEGINAGIEQCVDGIVRLRIQGHTLYDTALIRQSLHLSGAWTKIHSDMCDWWEFVKEYAGVRINIYACREAPKTCRKVDKVIEVDEQVPVRFEDQVQTVQVPVEFETRRVQKTFSEWVCDGADE